MKLITKAIEKKLAKFPLYSTNGKGNKEVIVKFFNPCGAGTWLVYEGEKLEDGDWEFFGSVDLGYGAELGYFRLSDLQSIRLPFGLTIERDMYYAG